MFNVGIFVLDKGREEGENMFRTSPASLPMGCAVTALY
jgi:hypothetical protein